MSSFDDAMSAAKNQMNDLGISYNEGLLEKVAKGLGPALYNRDASTVSCSDQSELDTVKNNFLIKKLGMSDGANLDNAIKGVCEKMGSSNRNKLRSVFYYLLVQELGQSSAY